jgi:putative thioredoxin
VTDTATVKDVTEARFRADVIEASRTRPVVVDFWAPWCGPCHQLSPLLEAAAARWAGEVDVVKVNVDEAPSLARAFQVQGIPAVKAFHGGTVVAQFTGVQPAQVIEQMFAALAPSQADRLAAAGDAAPGDAEAERAYRAALDEEADHPRAVVGLARILLDRDEQEEARALLGRVPSDPGARRLLAEMSLGDARDEDAVQDLRARVEAGDVQARVELGRALAAAGQVDDALAVLVDAVREPALREDARAAVLEVFELLGDADPRVRAWRPKLAAAIF